MSVRRVTLVCGTADGGKPCHRAMAVAAVVDGEVHCQPAPRRPPTIPVIHDAGSRWQIVSCSKHGPKVVAESEIREALGRKHRALTVARPAPPSIRVK